MPDTVPTDSGPMTVDQAVESLITPQPDEQHEAAPVAAVEAAQEPAETEAEQPAEDAAEEPLEASDADEQETEPAVEPVEPPKYWSQDAKAKFAALPPDLQAVVLEQEGPREAAAAKAKSEAAEQKAAASKEVEGVQRLATQLAEFLPQAVETFQQRWGEPDWAAVAQEHGADQAFILKSQHEAEARQLQKLAEAKQQAETQAHSAFIQAETEKLAGTPLADMTVRQEVGKYLTDSGIDPQSLSTVSAKELTIAHKAMLYDRAQAALKAKPKPVTPPPARSPVRPAAAQPGSSSQRTATTLANRFAQTHSVDDAVALLLAKGPRQ